MSFEDGGSGENSGKETPLTSVYKLADLKLPEGTDVRLAHIKNQFGNSPTHTELYTNEKGELIITVVGGTKGGVRVSMSPIPSDQWKPKKFKQH